MCVCGGGGGEGEWGDRHYQYDTCTFCAVLECIACTVHIPPMLDMHAWDVDCRGRQIKEVNIHTSRPFVLESAAGARLQMPY